MTAPWDLLYKGCRAATMVGSTSYGLIDDTAIAVADGKIVYIGPQGSLPSENAAIVRDLGGACVTPGLIDCHTHLVFGGDRADEFELRLTGTTYQEIQRAGGGIRSTVRKTRAASEDELLSAALWRAKRLMAEGVTTIEIKSGYGLDLDSEARMLRVARRLGRELPVTVKTTALCAHTVPPEFAGRADDYVAEIVDRMLPALAREGLVDAVDGFCDSIGFTHAQTARVFDTARALGLPVKLHADQVSAFGGAEVAARYGALSAEHLEYASEDGISAMAKAGTIAVILPGAYYYLRETTKPPIDLFRKHGANGDEHGLHVLLHDARRDARRCHTSRGNGTRHGCHPRHIGGRKSGRSCCVAHSKPWRTQLLGRCTTADSYRTERAGTRIELTAFQISCVRQHPETGRRLEASAICTRRSGYAAARPAASGGRTTAYPLDVFGPVA
jgi:imidazolonepropionase